MIKSYKEINGWHMYENIYEEAVQRAKDGGVFLEVGAWMGMSTAHMASLIRDSGKKIKFYTIDTWEGSFNEQCHIDVVMKNGGSIFNLFYKNLQELKLLEYVTPIISSSTKALDYIENNKFDFVMIDGNHTSEFVKKDVEYYWPLIKDGGFLTGDDVGWINLLKTVEDYFAKINKKVNIHEKDKNCWVVQK